MKLKKVWAVYFSGTGTTRRTVERIAGDIAARLGLPVQSVDFSRPSLRQETLRFSDTDLVVRHPGVRRARAQCAAAFFTGKGCGRRRTGRAGSALRQPKL